MILLQQKKKDPYMLYDFIVPPNTKEAHCQIKLHEKVITVTIKQTKLQ